MKDRFTREWILENSIDICSRYELGLLTLRALHYQLVGRGMTNTIQHYKRVVSAMEQARWEGSIPFEQFSDHDREMIGETNIDITDLDEQISKGKSQVRSWMNYYSKNIWENQHYYIEVFIEKKALQGIFQSPCAEKEVALGACKGYPSLTFLNDTQKRFKEAISKGKEPVMIYFGDYDPSGMNIPESIKENLSRFGVDIQIERVALNHDQVVKWKLPYAPVKEGDTRKNRFKGLGQVELDAIEPKRLQGMCLEAISKYFDGDAYQELMEREEEEKVEYRRELKNYVLNMDLD